MEQKQPIADLIAQSPNRRSFVKKLGLAGAVMGAVAATKGRAQNAPTIGDSDILNFALNLEYLGSGIPTLSPQPVPLFRATVSPLQERAGPD